MDAARLRPEESISLPARVVSLVGFDDRWALPTFLHEAKESFFLLWRDLASWDVAEGVRAGIEAIAFDVPSCAHFAVFAEVGAFFGTLGPEIIVP